MAGLGKATMIGAGLGALAGVRKDPETGKRRILRGALVGGGLGAGASYMAPGVSKGLRGAANLVEKPGETLSKAWKNMSPVADANRAETAGRIMERMAEGKKAPMHLIDKSKTLGGSFKDKGIKGVAEELSRRGWTGQGNVTKYMPVGEKGMAVGFGSMSAPTISRAFTGEGSFEDAGSEIGNQVGFMAAPGAGMIGGMVPGTLASKGLGGAGKLLDVGLGYNKRPELPDHGVPPGMNTPLGYSAPVHS